MDRIRFLHIPKSAGSTLSLMLSIQFLGRDRFSFVGEPDLDEDRFRALTQQQRDKVRWFDGHAPIHTGIREANSNIQIITMLRDPIHRVMSFCQHVSEGKSPKLADGSAGPISDASETFDLDRFLDSKNAELHNLQTKMLINVRDCATLRHIGAMGPAAATELACENLFNTVDCYGLQEYFDESLLMIQRRIGVRTPIYASRNSGRDDRALEFEQRHLDRIADLNCLDLELYAIARDRFLADLRSGGPGERELRRFRRQRDLADPMIRGWLRLRGRRAPRD